MSRARVLMIGLDGFEPKIAERLLAAGRLPALQRCRRQSATVPLDHGAAKRTGLAWEHVATGLSPEHAGRWGAVDFDPVRYRVVQRPTALKPFAASLEARTVVFDAPYFDLAAAPNVRGLVGWGAHDAGVALTARPDGLADEIAARFGRYPATRWIYGFTWPSPERTRVMAEALARAVDTRAQVAEWLLAERIPDWELALVVVSEFHSAIEPFWHGVDPDHPLHGLPSSEPSRIGIDGVYEAADRLVARLLARFPEARFVLFNLHGMGANDSDVASMALLPELLFRHRFGRPRLRERRWPTTAAGVPLIEGGRSWETELARLLASRLALPRSVTGRLKYAAGRLLRRRRPGELAIDWMPAAQYRRHWPLMPVFALPSFYDGRIRINLAGRERRGIVAAPDYRSAGDEVERLLRACRNPLTGEEVVEAIERAEAPEAACGASAADLVVLWRGAPLGLVHPALGRIGPLPYRRTGGHTGGEGVAYFGGPGIAACRLATRSAFDVVPTILDLLGERPAVPISGRSLIGEIDAALGVAAE